MHPIHRKRTITRNWVREAVKGIARKDRFALADIYEQFIMALSEERVTDVQQCSTLLLTLVPLELEEADKPEPSKHNAKPKPKRGRPRKKPLPPQALEG